MPRLALLLALLVLTPLAAHADGGAGDRAHDAAARVRAAAEAHLATRFPDAAPRLEVRVQRTGGTWADDAPLRLDFPAEGALPKAHTQVDVLTGSDALGWTKAGWALLYVAHYDSVLVPTRRIDRDTPVTPADLDAVWMETTRFRGEPLRPADLAARTADGQLMAARTLGEGRALRADDLRPPYAADTGSSVTMTYQRRGLTLTLRCQAREPGFTGDLIRLYAPGTDATYRARLTGPGTAEWYATL